MQKIDLDDWNRVAISRKQVFIRATYDKLENLTEKQAEELADSLVKSIKNEVISALWEMRHTLINKPSTALDAAADQWGMPNRAERNLGQAIGLHAIYGREVAAAAPRMQNVVENQLNVNELRAYLRGDNNA